MKALYATVDLLWSAKMSKNFDFEYGAGFGLGIIFGDLANNWVYQDDANGPLPASNGHSVLEVRRPKVRADRAAAATRPTTRTPTRPRSATTPSRAGSTAARSPSSSRGSRSRSSASATSRSRTSQAASGWASASPGFWFGLNGALRPGAEAEGVASAGETACAARRRRRRGGGSARSAEVAFGPAVAHNSAWHRRGTVASWGGVALASPPQKHERSADVADVHDARPLRGGGTPRQGWRRRGLGRSRSRHRTELALKVLGEDAGEAEAMALVREAVTLSGLEGLGVPRVVAFGSLPGARAASSCASSSTAGASRT